MPSNTFQVIRRLAVNGRINNRTGFTANDVIENSNLHPPTVRTFLPKHTVTEIIYFRKVRPGLYKILPNHLR